MVIPLLRPVLTKFSVAKFSFEVESEIEDMAKTIFVIGAGKGLGNAVAEKFAQNDFRVVLMSRNENNLSRYQQQFRAKGFETYSKAVDASDFQNVKKVFQGLVKEYGTPDVLFFNVGVTIADKEVELTPELFIERYKTDVISAYNCIELVNTKEFQDKRGCILITGGGLAMNPYYDYLPLSMDKAALRALVKAYSPVLKEKGVYIGSVQITGVIGSNEYFAPNEIAQVYWKLYRERTPEEIVY